MKKRTNNTAPPVPFQRLVRCVRQNFVAAMIANPILVVFFVGVRHIGGHPGIEWIISGMIGLNLGWILGMAALLFVARFYPANA